MAKPRPIKLLLVSPLPPPVGGIATWTKLLLAELARHQNIEVSHVNTALRWRSILSQSLWLRIFGGSWQALEDGLHVLKLLILKRPHVIHLTTSARLGLVRDLCFLILAKMFGVRSFLHIRDPRVGQLRPNQKWQMRLTLFAIGFADCIIALDSKTHELLSSRLTRSQVMRIPNMVSLEEIDKIVGQNPSKRDDSQNDSFQLVFVGRITTEKGIEDLVEACIHLNDTELHCLGPIDQPCRARIEQAAQLRDDGQWLHLHGHLSREEVLRHVHQSDLFVLPSHFEAFPNAILECMALSKPIVATDVGAVAEMIHAGDSLAGGLCVKPRDVEELRNAITHLRENPEQRAKMGSCGRLRVEALYSTTHVIPLLIQHWAG